MIKIPTDKLPLQVGQIGQSVMYGQYPIGCKKLESWHDSIAGVDRTRVNHNYYCGRILYKDLSQYVVEASNKFPKALELLNLTLDGDFLPEELQEEIIKFLE